MKKFGYKCFNFDMTNRYGDQMMVGEFHSKSCEIKFGSSGFHFCENMEDTFRYFDAFNEQVSVCFVRGYGKIDEYEDDYNGYYDMYSSENIEIIRKLSRKEIIENGLSLIEFRVCRFVSSIKLSNDEIELFKEKFKNSMRVLDAIEYYQIGNKDIYNKRI